MTAPVLRHSFVEKSPSPYHTKSAAPWCMHRANTRKSHVHGYSTNGCEPSGSLFMPYALPDAYIAGSSSVDSTF